MDKNILEKFNHLHKDIKQIASYFLIETSNLEQVYNRVNQKPKILVVGEFNAGKSSLINSALGDNLLPTGLLPTTSLITILEHGPLKVSIKQVGTTDALVFEPKKASNVGFGLDTGIYDWEGFQKFITDSKNIEKVEFVTLYHPNVPENLCIIDTPGINDISKSRAEIIYGFIPYSDVIIFVISALKPFAESERIFLEEKILTSDIKKIYFAINRIDEIEPDERQELISEIKNNVIKSINNAYKKINAQIGKEIYTEITDIEIFPTCAKFFAPITSKSFKKTIGFDISSSSVSTKIPEQEQLTQGNFKLWSAILENTVTQKDKQATKLLIHTLDVNISRIEKSFNEYKSSLTTEKENLTKRLIECANKLSNLITLINQAERKIIKTEEYLKNDFKNKIEQVFQSLSSKFFLQREPKVINEELKQLYEYITTKLKITLDELYKDVGHSFDLVVDDKKFLEERKFELRYDFSHLPDKLIDSFRMWLFTTIFFGPNIGLIAGGLYFASQVIANKRSVQQYLMNARVSQETLDNVKKELIEKVDKEVEYAVDYVRQSLIQKIDLIQSEVKQILYLLKRPSKLNISELESKLTAIKANFSEFCKVCNCTVLFCS